MHIPDAGWVGNCEIRGINEANVTSSAIGLSNIALSTDPNKNRVLAAANLPDDLFFLQLEGLSITPPVEYDSKAPFGSGWISWYLVPRLNLRGQLTFSNIKIDLQESCGYNDHNWGRWYWGDDLGWEWGVFMSSNPGWTFVFNRVANRERTKHRNSQLLFQHNFGRKVYSEFEVSVRSEGILDKRLRRVPGPLAALFQDKICPLLPSSILIHGERFQSSLTIRFRARAAAQIIASDPIKPGYSFIHEIVGEFSAWGQIDGVNFKTSGLAVVEYVN